MKMYKNVLDSGKLYKSRFQKNIPNDNKPRHRKIVQQVEMLPEQH